MDPELRQKRQSRRVIISEICMVLAVAATVLVLAFVVSGYWVNSDFKVERQGMLQISSVPTGASVEVDGDAPWFQRTNTSKVLSSGEHSIKLTKEGYDTWSKTINIREGLLYRIHYPRLFLLGREPTTVYNAAGTTLATVSPDRNRMLLINNTATWQLLNLENDNLVAEPVDISALFSTATAGTAATDSVPATPGTFSGTIKSLSWDNDNEHILLSVTPDGSDKLEWVLLNVRSPKSSINITSQFGADFDKIQIYDNSSSNLLAIRAGNLHKIDLAARQVSAILAEDVQNFDHFGSEIIFVAKKDIEPTTDIANSAETPAPYYLGVIKSGSVTPTSLMELSAPAVARISKFYDDKYLTLLSENVVTVYKRDNLEQVLQNTISFIPELFKIGHDGEFVVMKKDTTFAVLDMEAQTINEWAIDSLDNGWLDGDMLYAINNGTLTVYDFDGLNRRELSTNVSASFPVTITSDKWLYYFSDGKLLREKI